jgi:hypothetical protein
MPHEVVRRYAECYNFLFLTDHGVVDNVDSLNALFGWADSPSSYERNAWSTTKQS